MHQLDDKVRKLALLDRQKIAIAKAKVLDVRHEQPLHLVRLVLEALRVQNFDREHQPLVFSEGSRDEEYAIEAIAAFAVWKAATLRAVAELLAAGVIFPGQDSVWRSVPPLAIHFRRQANHSGVPEQIWIGDLCLAVPTSLVFLSENDQQSTILSDSDLFLNNLEIDGMDSGIEESLREAVRCFRAEMFTPCVAMLGRASEGAWVECGLALLEVFQKATSNSDSKSRRVLLGESTLPAKVKCVKDLFQRQELEPVRKATTVDLGQLRHVELWSDTVRDSRNVLHYGVVPAMPNDYTKTAALLLSTTPNLRRLYAIRRTAVKFLAAQS